MKRRQCEMKGSEKDNGNKKKCKEKQKEICKKIMLNEEVKKSDMR